MHNDELYRIELKHKSDLLQQKEELESQLQHNYEDFKALLDEKKMEYENRLKEIEDCNR